MKILILFLLTFAALAKSETEFKQLANFKDKNCPTWEIERFKNVKDYFYLGVETAKRYGFTYAYPIERNGVDMLWCATLLKLGKRKKECNTKLYKDPLRPFAFLEKSNPDESEIKTDFANKEEQYMAYLSYVTSVVEKENITDPSDGAILEILARHYLQELTDLYPSSDYTIASGIEYRKKEGRTIGELDIVVFEKTSCDVVAIGESKASNAKNQGNSLIKAKDQLRRIREFIEGNI